MVPAVRVYSGAVFSSSVRIFNLDIYIMNHMMMT